MNIADGVMAVEGKGCWMAKGKNAWVPLTWDFEKRRNDSCEVWNE